MKWRIAQQEKKLDNLFTVVSVIKDEEIQSYLSKFLCIRTSGFVESSLKNLIGEYIQGTSPKAVENYVNFNMKYVTNLKDDKLVEVLRRFNEDWANQLNSLLTDKQRDALNSIISNRNNIAHGETDNISYTLMKNYFTEIKEIVRNLESIIKK